MKAIAALAAIYLGFMCPAMGQEIDPLDATFLPRTAGGRSQWAAAIERHFLANGLSIRVWSHDAKPRNQGADPLQRYPRLVLFGYFNDSVVYQIATTLKLFQQARKLGFAGVEFFGKGSNGGYWYDISKQDYGCDIKRRLCI